VSGSPPGHIDHQEVAIQGCLQAYFPFFPDLERIAAFQRDLIHAKRARQAEKIGLTVRMLAERHAFACFDLGNEEIRLLVDPKAGFQRVIRLIESPGDSRWHYWDNNARHFLFSPPDTLLEWLTDS